MSNNQGRYVISDVSITQIAKGNIVQTVRKLWQGIEIFRIMFHTEPAGLLVPIPQTEEELIKVCRAIREASRLTKAATNSKVDEAALIS